MILTEERQNTILGIDQDTTINMQVDSSNMKKLMMVLSENLYSDGIGSLIREYTTNALDAQREAGVTDPIHVSLVKEGGKFVFSVKDLGMGLSPDRIENVFSKYLASTKESSNDQLGYYGLGSKSALAYRDSFTILSVYDKVEYTYLMFRGEEGTQLSLMDMNDTDAHNGVTIKVTLKEEEDYEVFLEKMKRQLAYFEGVFFTTEYDDIENDFKIIKNENWKYSELNQDKYLHMSLDNVYYPIDFEKLGIEPIAIPLALNLSLRDGLVPTPNREQILYSPQTKALILSKIKLVADFLISKWNSVAPEAPDLFTAESLYQSHGIITLWEDEDNLNVGDRQKITLKLDKKIEKFATVPMVHVSMPQFPNLPLKRIIETKGSMLSAYTTVAQIKYDKYTGKTDYDHVNLSLTRPILFLKEGESLSKLQIEYLKHKYNNRSIIDIVRKTRNIRLGKKVSYNGSTDNYYGLLQLRTKPRNMWRTIIGEYCALIKTYTDKWLSIEDAEPTQDYLDWRKANRVQGSRRNLLKTEVNVAIAREKEVYDHTNKPVYDKTVYRIEQLSKLNGRHAGIYIYSTEDRIPELYNLFQIGNLMQGTGVTKYKAANNQIGKQKFTYDRIHTATFSERNYKKVKGIEIDNWINLDNLTEKRNRVIADFLSLFLMKEFVKSTEIQELINHKYFIYLVDKTMGLNLNALTERDDWEWRDKVSNISKGFIYRMLKLYIEKRWLNSTMLYPLYHIYKNTNNFSFLKALKINSIWDYYTSGSFDTTKVSSIAYHTIEVKIARSLYGKYGVANFGENKLRNFDDFIEKVLLNYTPIPIRNRSDEWDDRRQESDDDDVSNTVEEQDED